jgi:hypothetical protein
MPGSVKRRADVQPLHTSRNTGGHREYGQEGTANIHDGDDEDERGSLQGARILTSTASPKEGGRDEAAEAEKLL